MENLDPTSWIIIAMITLIVLLVFYNVHNVG